MQSPQSLKNLYQGEGLIVCLDPRGNTYRVGGNREGPEGNSRAGSHIMDILILVLNLTKL